MYLDLVSLPFFSLCGQKSLEQQMQNVPLQMHGRGGVPAAQPRQRNGEEYANLRKPLGEDKDRQRWPRPWIRENVSSSKYSSQPWVKFAWSKSIDL